MLKMKKTVLALSISAALFGQAAIAAVTNKDIEAAIENVSGIENQLISDLYNKAIIEEMSIENTVKLLSKYATDSKNKRATRANAYITAAHMQWRYGLPNEAIAFVDKALKLAKSADGLLLKARLLDTQGQAKAAGKLYQQAFDKTTSVDEKEFIQIRLTMIDSSVNSGALITLANERDQAFKNRAAVALALLGYQQDAIDLYKVESDAAKPFRQHIRLADWAIKGKDYKLAQEQAWAAYQVAGARYNARYAIAVLLEAYRDDNKLAEVEQLLAKHDSDPELQQARIDVLVEMSRYDDAIALFKKTNTDNMDMALRQRLLQLYLSADRDDDMITEYRKLMKHEPQQAAWYQGLAAHYMNIGEPEQAKRVWQQLEASNQGHISTLIDGAQSMIDMGMRDDAMAMLVKHQNGAESYFRVHMFLFEAFLNAGDNTAATEVVDSLKAMLPERAAELKDVADAYERLGRPDKALAIYTDLSNTKAGLGYDERMRLAWLHSINNNKQEALTHYQQLWGDVASPARRSFIEAQMLLIAAELGTLGKIVIDLENKLYVGTADKRDLDLLVRIYVESNDMFSATSVIEEYIRNNNLPEVDRLQQLAQVYMIMQDYEGYDKVLHKLMVAEPDFKADHIRNIILNLLSNDTSTGTEERLVKVNNLLAELAKTEGRQVQGEFEASVMNMGGYTDKAIESYRKSLAQNPADADNMLLMSELMKDQGRTDEAVAMLQYLAEHAKGDNEFVVAIDGIINMIGGLRFGQVLPEKDRNTFKWAHRTILERITARKGKFYLYTLLSEIANETGNSEGEFSAVENSLAQADIRRSATLRQLITMSTGANFGGNQRTGDSERKIVYGRRLVGLSEELPPDIYIDLGNSLLVQGDVAGAEKAFNMITDITGLIDIDKTKAEAFLKAGYLDQALINFNSALSRNQDDLSLLSQTALLRERNDQDDIANNWYWKSLEVLLREQNAVLKNAPQPITELQVYGRRNTSVTRSYRAYYEHLVQGLIITWPVDEAMARKRQQQIVDMLIGELTSVKKLIAEKGQVAFAQYARLDYMSRFVRRVAQATDNRQMAETVDKALLSVFAEDKGYAKAIAKAYAQWGAVKQLAMVEKTSGYVDPQYNSDPLSVLEAGMRRAQRTKNVKAVSGYAQLLNDHDAAEAALVQLMRDGNFADAFRNGMSLLDTAGFKRFVNSHLRNNETTRRSLFKLATERTGLFKQVEATLGRQLLTGDDLAKLTRVKSTALSSAPSRNLAVRGGANDVLLERMAAEEYFDYAYQKVMSAKPSQSGVVPGTTELRSMLLMPLNDAQREKALEGIRYNIGLYDFKNERGVNLALDGLLVLDAHPGNIDLLIEMGNIVNRKAAKELQLGAAIKAYFSGNHATALTHLLATYKANNIVWNSRAPWLRQYFSGVIDEALVQLTKGESLPDHLATLAYTVKYSLPVNVQLTDERIAALKSLVRMFPGNRRYQTDLAIACWKNGDVTELERTLKQMAKIIDSDSLMVASTLMALYQKQGRYLDAVAAATAGETNLLTPGGKKQLADKIEILSNNPNGVMNSLAIIYQSLMVDPSDQKSTGVTGSRSAASRQEDLRATYYADLAASLKAGDNAKARTQLRAIWRNYFPVNSRGTTSIGEPYADLFGVPFETDANKIDLAPLSVFSARSTNLSTSLLDQVPQQAGNSDQSQQPRLLDELVKAPFFADELNRYLQGMSVVSRRKAHSLYMMLARAHQYQGNLDAEIARLSKVLSEQKLGDHNYQQYLSMLELKGGALKGRPLADLKRLAQQLTEPTNSQLLQLAKVFARSGEQQLAADYFRSLAASVLYFTPNGRRGVPTTPFMTLQSVIQQAGAVLSPEYSQALLLDIYKLVALQENSGGLASAFLVSSSERLMGPMQAVAILDGMDSELLGVEGDHPVQFAQRVAQIDVLTKAQQFDRAWQILRELLVEPDGELTIENPRETIAVGQMLGINLMGVMNNRELAPDWAAVVYDWDRLFGDQSQEWLEAVSTKLAASLNDSQLAQNRVSELTLAIVMELGQRGANSHAAERLLQTLAQKMVSASEQYSERQWSQIVDVANESGMPLQKQAIEFVANRKLLNTEQQVAIIRALNSRADVLEGLETARLLASGSDRLLVLVELERLAKKAGDTELEVDLNRRIQQQQAAKEKLTGAA